MVAVGNGIALGMQDSLEQLLTFENLKCAIGGALIFLFN